jgi:molybdopterin-guanine dinucleotide biosynthesis protein A
MLTGVIILAGGNGTRIGTKKAFLKMGDASLLSIVHSAAQELSDEIVIVINDDDNSNPVLKLMPKSTKIVPDLVNGFGPLMGIYSGLKQITAEYALILPCDTPFVKLDLMRKILSSKIGYNAVIPQWANGFLEPLHSVYHVVHSISAIECALKMGERSILDLIKRLDPIFFIPVESLRDYDPNLTTFKNINYLKDYVEAKQLFMSLKESD